MQLSSRQTLVQMFSNSLQEEKTQQFRQKKSYGSPFQRTGEGRVEKRADFCEFGGGFSTVLVLLLATDTCFMCYWTCIKYYTYNLNGESGNISMSLGITFNSSWSCHSLMFRLQQRPPLGTPRAWSQRHCPLCPAWATAPKKTSPGGRWRNLKMPKITNQAQIEFSRIFLPWKKI